MPSLLSQPNFARYLIARLAGTLAVQIQVVGVGWQMYALTRDPFALGLVGLVQFLPSLLLIPVAGPVIDRIDRRLVIILARGVEALIAGMLAWQAWHDTLTPASLYVAVALLGMARAFDFPAAQALLPRMVAPDWLSRAIAASSSTGQVATIAGPALGGALYLGGPALVYGMAATLFALGSLLMLFVRDRGGPPPPVQRITWSYLFGGFAFIRQRPVLLGAISLDMVAVLMGGATALLPIFAQDILLTGPIGLGLLRAAPAVGALATAVWLARHPLGGGVGRTLFRAVVVFGLATVAFALSGSLWLSLIALTVLGAADEVSVVIRLSLVQLETPDDMRGRVSAVNGVFIGASNQIGEFESGAVAALVGPVGSALIGGVGTLGVAALWKRLFPALHARDRLEAPRAP